MKGILIIIILATVLTGADLSAQTYSEGSSYFGRNNYIEYMCGGLPLIISVPHGGNLTPSEIPDRTCGTTVTDSYTMELSLELRDEIYDITGRYPHVIINHLKRIKLDANRDVYEATCGDAEAAIAWEEYHKFIDSAKLYVTNTYNKGLFIDLHGQSSHGERIELGYMLTGEDLRQSDATLNTPEYENKSSIRNLVSDNVNNFSFSELLRGDYALGTMLEDEAYTTIPSLENEYPVDAYFSGGYNTERHGSKDGGTIDAVQMECNRQIRFDESDRLAFAGDLSGILLAYLKKHYFPNIEDFYDNGTGIEYPEDTGTRFFPNPAYERIVVETEKPVEMKIYSLAGQLVFSSSVNSGRVVHLKGLNKGFYLVVFSQKGIVTSKEKLIINQDN